MPAAKARVAREVRSYAWTALEVVCKDPGSVTAATALVKAAEAYAAITLALREDKAAESLCRKYRSHCRRRWWRSDRHSWNPFHAG